MSPCLVGHLGVVCMPCHSYLMAVYHLVCVVLVIRIELEPISLQILYQLLVEQ